MLTIIMLTLSQKPKEMAEAIIVSTMANTVRAITVKINILLIPAILVTKATIVAVGTATAAITVAVDTAKEATIIAVGMEAAAATEVHLFNLSNADAKITTLIWLAKMM